MRGINAKTKRRGLVAAAAVALTVGTAGPASAGLGDPGPGGPVRFDVATDFHCNYLTGKLDVTVTLSQDPAYSSWQYAGVYYQDKPLPANWGYYDVSGMTQAGAGWLGPGSAPLTYKFSVPPPSTSQWLEVSNIDIYPNDGWYTDESLNAPHSCILIIPWPIIIGSAKTAK